MTYFPEIIRILDRFRAPRIETVDGEFRANTEDKSFLLYDGIRNGTFRNDQSAAAAIYESSSLDPKYATLKSRLKWRLFNTLFHLNLKRAGFSEFSVASYAINRRAFLTKSLLSLGARSAGSKLASRTLRDALRYEFTSVAIDMAVLLRTHASVTASRAEYERLNKIVAEQLRILGAEIESWEHYERSTLVTMTKENPGEEFVQELLSRIEALRSYQASVNTVVFLTNYFRLLIMKARASHHNLEALKMCQEAIDALNKRPHLVPPARLAEFTLGKLEAYTSLKDYTNAVAAAKESANLFGAGSNNWFALKQREFLLLMLSKNFIDAETLYDQVIGHDRFAALPDVWHERWKIYELYLQFGLQSVPGTESLPLRKKFDLQAFLRFIPVAAKDKHGMYVAVLIIHILYMLESGDFGGIIDRMDSLRTYRSRYLRGKLNRRSALFFRLLNIMEANSFNYTLVHKKGDRFYQELLVTEDEQVATDEEIQIIPYDWLWERAMAKLKEYEDAGRK